MMNFDNVTKKAYIQNINNSRLCISVTISWFKLISLQPDFDKTYSYPKDLHEAKYQFLISKHENTGLTLYRMGLFGAVHK